MYDYYCNCVISNSIVKDIFLLERDGNFNEKYVIKNGLLDIFKYMDIVYDIPKDIVFGGINIAVAAGQYDMFLFMLELGYGTHKNTKFLATAGGNISIIKYIHEYIDHFSNKDMKYIVHHESLHVVRYLYSIGLYADINNNIYTKACTYEYLYYIGEPIFEKYMVKILNSNIMDINNDICTSEISSNSIVNHIISFRRLDLFKIIKVTFTDDMLVHACSMGSLKIIRYLISVGIFNNTLLNANTHYFNYDVLILLHNYDFCITEDGISRIVKSKKESVKFLYDINVNKQSILKYAIIHKNLSIIRELISFIDDSSLLLAIEQNNYIIIKTIHDGGIKITKEVIYYAVKCGSVNVIDYISDVDIPIPNDSLEISIKNNDILMIEMLVNNCGLYTKDIHKLCLHRMPRLAGKINYHDNMYNKIKISWY